MSKSNCYCCVIEISRDVDVVINIMCKHDIIAIHPLFDGFIVFVEELNDAKMLKEELLIAGVSVGDITKAYQNDDYFEYTIRWPVL